MGVGWLDTEYASLVFLGAERGDFSGMYAPMWMSCLFIFVVPRHGEGGMDQNGAGKGGLGRLVRCALRNIPQKVVATLLPRSCVKQCAYLLVVSQWDVYRIYYREILCHGAVV